MQVFWGLDEWGAREEIERIAKEAEVTVRWVDKEALAEKPLWQWVDEGKGGLFGAWLVVALDPEGWKKTDQEVLREMVSGGQEKVVVWQRGAVDKRSAWFARAKKAGRTREFPELSARQLSAWAQEYGRGEGGVVEPAAAAELVARVGANRWQLGQELDKLLLRWDVVTTAVVRDGIPTAAVEGEIFALLDAVAGGNRSEAARRLTAILESGESEFYVLSMMGYQLRTLLAIRSGQEAGQGEREVAKEAGLHPFVVQKNWQAARRWSREQLVGLMTRLLATDGAIKRGAVGPKVGVTMLVMGVARG